MTPRWKAALVSGTAFFAGRAGALAQSPPPASSQAPLFDPQQLPAQRGQVQQFTLTPRGDIDGLILVDGTEVKTPPHLSTEIVHSIRPGDTVTIHGHAHADDGAEAQFRMLRDAIANLSIASHILPGDHDFRTRSGRKW